MNYSVEITSRAMKELEIVPDHVYSRVKLIIENLSENPRPTGAIKLKGAEKRWRIRVGDYRMLLDIDDKNNKVEIRRVIHRKDAYR